MSSPSSHVRGDRRRHRRPHRRSGSLACRRASRGREPSVRRAPRSTSWRSMPTARRSPTCNRPRSKSGSAIASGRAHPFASRQVTAAPAERAGPGTARRMARTTAWWPAAASCWSSIRSPSTRGAIRSSGARSRGCWRSSRPPIRSRWSRAALRRGQAALHLRQGTHPARDRARDRPGIAHRDRIRSRLPDAPLPRIPRRHAAGAGDAHHAADPGALHRRSRRSAARRADGTGARHVRAPGGPVPAAWRQRPARRAPTSM